MKYNDQKIKEILLAGNYVTAEDIAKADAFAKSRHLSVVDYFLAEGLLTKDLLGQAIAGFFKVPYADLNSNKPSREAVLRIPEAFARRYRSVIFKEDETGITIACDNPIPQLYTVLQAGFPGKKISLAYSLPEDIDEIFVHYKKALETRFVKIVNEQKKVAPEIIEEILADALAYRASDIHFEPQEGQTVIRLRVDGVLQEVGRIPNLYYENILNRIKIQAHLRIDEHFSAQDGAIHFSKDGKTTNIRISISPTLDGEKVVMRLLAKYVQEFTLSDLGLSKVDQEVLQEAAKKPFGMILSAGPTGSGKSTTLYALLKILNRPEVNITTIEDPVEYKIIGVNHIQVNPSTNLTFAKGLRSIVRQDPDIILVGEIRDTETAEIAVNAALTGHLLLSSFHANDAATAIARLLDMNVEPFLLASTLEVIIAQRLVRRVCEKCRFSYPVEETELKKLLPNYQLFFSNKSLSLYKGKGCETCGHTGYMGRTAIFEFIRITDEMEDLILKSPSTKQVWDLARSQGARSLFEDGIEKVKNGITTLEELVRVAPPPSQN